MLIHSLYLRAHAEGTVTLTRSFVLSEQMREIPDGETAIVTRPEKLEAALLGIYRSIGLPTPTPVQDPAGTSDSMD